MARRDTHTGRTHAQREQYVRNVVQGGTISGTVADPLDDRGNATGAGPVDGAPEMTREPTRRRSARKPGFWETHRTTIINSIIGALVVALVGGATVSIANLNRELGQLQQSSSDSVRHIDDVRNRITRTEDRINQQADSHKSALEKLGDKIDELRNRIHDAMTGKGKQ